MRKLLLIAFFLLSLTLPTDSFKLENPTTDAALETAVKILKDIIKNRDPDLSSQVFNERTVINFRGNIYKGDDVYKWYNKIALEMRVFNLKFQFMNKAQLGIPEQLSEARAYGVIELHSLLLAYNFTVVLDEFYNLWIEKVTARADGTVSEDTLRGAFQLENDVPLGLFKHEVALERRRKTDEFVFELQPDWVGNEFDMVWKESERSRAATIIGPTKLKRQRIDMEYEERPVDGDLAASVAPYTLFYLKKDNFKRCAIPLTTRLAATYRHGENKSLNKGDLIVIRSWFDSKLEVSTRVVKIIEELDTIILQSEGGDLCIKDLISDAVSPRKGMHYLMVGFFRFFHNQTNHQSLSTGIIASGDSGGSCWSESGSLIGMQVEVDKVQHTKDEKPASPESGGGCCLVAIRDILAHIQDLLPPDSEVDWSE
ncbi:unnamed protein product [Caenorhabditis auriculariae]|uniref:Peptidase S1 domain-containing protein n=1 Tax=Caenorhabditis auriculariae TaxID=2777116 RepID=A0A8S1HAR4_9PELO|nr:unnamed protein product [Caenorhabditis auriculariae]